MNEKALQSEQRGKPAQTQKDSNHKEICWDSGCEQTHRDPSGEQSSIDQLVTWITLNPSFLTVHGIDPDEPYELSDFAHGECNHNYLLTTDKRSFLIRRSLISQMHLARQIAYEYHALSQLAGCNRTPRPFILSEPDRGSHFINNNGIKIPVQTAPPFAFLTMELLPGRPLSYDTDLTCAAHILAEIHEYGSKRMGETNNQKSNISHQGLPGFIAPRSPEQAMLDECATLMERYLTWEDASGSTCMLLTQLTRMLTSFAEKNQVLFSEGTIHQTLINTELNSGNFLIVNPEANEGFLVDWEKPLWADCAQDLGHFLAPTTTLWKTETVLLAHERDAFVDVYQQTLHDYQPGQSLIERVHAYTALTCLRGVSWCAWAAAEYTQKPLTVDATEQAAFSATLSKIHSYLTDSFLESLITHEVKPYL